MRLEDATILGDWGTTNLRLWLVGTGEIGSIILPTPHVTCPASGATGTSDVYITSALFGLPENVEESENPAGKTFLIKGAFQGLPNVPVKLRQPNAELTT